MLTPDQLEQVQSFRSTGGLASPSASYTDPEQAKAAFSASAVSKPASNIPNSPMASASPKSDVNSPANKIVHGTVDKTAKDYSNASSNFIAEAGKNDASTSKNPIIRTGENALASTASGLDTVFSPVSNAIKSTVDQASNEKGIQDVAQSPVVSKILDFFGNLGTGLDQIEQAHPEATRNIKNAITVLTAALGEKSATDVASKTLDSTKAGLGSTADSIKQGVDTATQVAKDTAGKVKTAVTPNPAVMNETKVTDLYNRAIRPTVVGKSTAGQVAKASDQVISGAKAIVENKPNLSFTDANGETVTGQSPKSVDQFSQAIQQTKANIYQKYNALAQQAGENGVTVDAPSIGKELDPVINSKSLAIANPKAVQYAQSIQSRLEAAGGIDAQTAQEVIQHYNESLKAFYKNPTYDTASSASIDSLVANKFRAELDKGITGATGSQYQDLKNQYGALSSMEKDVAHRNVVWGRQNKIGLASNIANISSAAELVKGLATLNPVDLAIGTGIKGAQMYMRYLNNPDVGVSKLFSEIEKGGPSSTGGTLAQAGLDIKSGSYQQPSTSSPKVQGEIPKSTLTKDTSLTGEDARVQDASIAKYQKDPVILTTMDQSFHL